MSGRAGARVRPRRPLVACSVALLLASCGGGGGGDAGAPPAASGRAAGSAGCRSGVQAAPLRGVRRELDVGDETRAYLLDVPPGPTDEPRPLLLAFHGFRAAPGRLRRWTGLGRAALRNGWIAAFPEGHDGVTISGATGRGWDASPDDQRDLAFVTALLDALERDWCIDPRRVWIAGMSNGAQFASLLACRMPERLAAAALVAGARALTDCPAPRPLPVLIVHGANDKVIAPEVAEQAREWWAEENGCTGSRSEQYCRFYEGCRADLTYCEAPQGHWWPRPATRRIVGFFEAHVRP